MNSLHAASASKDNNTQRTVLSVSVQRATPEATVMRDALIIALYTVCYYFLDAVTVCRLFI